jgi:hypothetical protein
VRHDLLRQADVVLECTPTRVAASIATTNAALGIGPSLI